MSRAKVWFLATRPWSLSMSAISVSVGAALAAVEGGEFLWDLYLLTLLGIVFLHTAGNMTNDYFDVRTGVDQPDTSTAAYRPHPLLEGRIAFGPFMAVVLTFYGLAALIGFYLAATRGVGVLVLGLLGALGAWTYTGPPLRYKLKGLGEFGVFLLWGPLMVLGSYYVQRQSFSPSALLVSVPFGALVALVLLANNIRDIETDDRSRIKTLPVLIGQKNGLKLFIGLIGLAYLAVSIMALLGPLPIWSLIVLLSLPAALPLVRAVKVNVPDDMDAQTAKLDTSFGVLLVASLVLGNLF